MQKTACPSYSAFFRLLPDRRLRIHFLKRELSPIAIQSYFGGGQFVMPFPFELPPELLKSLGIEKYRIHSGVYMIQEDKEHIMVDL